MNLCAKPLLSVVWPLLKCGLPLTRPGPLIRRGKRGDENVFGNSSIHGLPVIPSRQVEMLRCGWGWGDTMCNVMIEFGPYRGQGRGLTVAVQIDWLRVANKTMDGRCKGEGWAN